MAKFAVNDGWSQDLVEFDHRGKSDEEVLEAMDAIEKRIARLTERIDTDENMGPISMGYLYAERFALVA